MDHEDGPPRKQKRPQPRSCALKQATMNGTIQAQEAQSQSQSQSQTQAQSTPVSTPLRKQAPQQQQQQHNASTPTTTQHLQQSLQTPLNLFSPQEPSYSQSPSTPVIQEDTYPHEHQQFLVETPRTPKQAMELHTKYTDKTKDVSAARSRLAAQSKKMEELEAANAALVVQNDELSLINATMYQEKGYKQQQQDSIERSQILDVLPQVAEKDWKIDALEKEVGGLKSQMATMKEVYSTVETNATEAAYENSLMSARIRELEEEYLRPAAQRQAQAQAGANAGDDITSAINTLFEKTRGAAGAFSGGDIDGDGEYDVTIESLPGDDDDDDDDNDDEDDDDDEDEDDEDDEDDEVAKENRTFADESTLTRCDRKLDAIMDFANNATNAAQPVATANPGSDTEVVPDEFEYHESTTDEASDEGESTEEEQQHQLSAILEVTETEDTASIHHTGTTTVARISKKRKHWGPEFGGVTAGGEPSPKRQDRGREIAALGARQQAAKKPQQQAQQQVAQTQQQKQKQKKKQQQQQDAAPDPMMAQAQDQIKEKDKVIERYRSRQWRLRDLAERISKRKVTTRERAIAVKRKWLAKDPDYRLVR